ncbi:MAG: PepSY-like domain-containing protein [Muribaculaceae bacterium]|nr:PepSY-like domain-containing protein [Muribaculaceae bacterium]
MKKLLKFMPLLLVAVLGVTTWSCDDDDKDEAIAITMLPNSAKEFVTTYFSNAVIVSAKIDGDEYEARLSDGTTIDFDKTGAWTDVDAPKGKTIPSGFYPAAIDTYVTTNYAGNGINEISKEKRGYDVELVSGVDLVFDTAGEFISIDR